MKVLAVRDDGALLVGNDDEPAGVIVSEDGMWGTSQDAALSRGSWSAPDGQTVPTDAEQQINDILTEWNHDLIAEYPHSTGDLP